MAKIEFGDRSGIARYRLKPGHILEFTYSGRSRVAVVIAPTWNELCHCYEFSSLGDIPDKILEWIRSERPFNAEELYADFGNIYAYRSYKLFGMTGLRSIEFEIIDEEPEAQTEELTPTELRLFNALMDSRGRTQTRQSLLEQAWDVPVGTVVSTRTVDMHVKRLRAKGIAIQSIRGFGYRIKQEVMLDPL